MAVSDNFEADAAATVDRLGPADHAAAIDLWVASWREAMPAIDFETRRGWIAAHLADPALLALAIRCRSALLGFATLEGAYLHQIVVAPACKGTTTAASLLDACRRAAAPSPLVLDVNEGNGRAVRFYRKHGFVVEARGRNPTSGLPTLRLRATATGGSPEE